MKKNNERPNSQRPKESLLNNNNRSPVNSTNSINNNNLKNFIKPLSTNDRMSSNFE